MSQFGQNQNIYVSSKQRIGTDASNFVINFNPALRNPSQVSVIDCQIPVSWVPFDDLNNKIAFAFESAPETVLIAEIPTGRYYSSFDDLGTAMKTAMNEVADDKFTSVTNNENTFQFTWTASESFQFRLPNSILHDNSYEMLGLGCYSPSSYETSITAPCTATLMKTEAVYVVSNTIPSSTTFSSFPNGRQVLCKVPVNGNYGHILTYEDKSDQNSIPLDRSIINEMSFSLIDDRGFPIELRGRNWSIALVFRYD
jgi:hypothetical protein